MNTTPTGSPAATLILSLEFNQVRLTDKIPISELARPDNNFIATGILARLLNAILESSGQLVSSTICGGPLNHSLYMCGVVDVNVAAKTIWPVLGEISLAGGAKIFRFDDAEGILRCIFPAGGDIASYPELLQKVLTADNLTRTGKARADELTRLIERLQQAKKPGGDAKQ
jgi:hypothetical protein